MNAKKLIFVIALAVVVVCVVALMRATAIPRPPDAFDGIARVNQQIVTEEEFREYMEATVQRKHFTALGMEDVGDLEHYLNAYIKEKVLMEQDTRRRGIFENEDFLRACQLGEDKLIAYKYRTGKLRELITVTDEDLKEIAPSQWVQLKLRQILLSNEAQARAVLAKAREGEDFVGLVREYSIGPGANRDGDLGYKFPGSGYFSRVDEAYLFSLDVGAISDVLDTPLGPAICKVEDRKVFTDEEIEEFLGKPKSVIFNRKVEEHINEIKEKSGVTLFLDALRASVRAVEVADKQDALIARVGDREFYFFDLQRTLSVPYDRIYIDPTLEDLYSLYTSNLKRKVDDYLLAREAAVFGIGVETEAERKELKKFAQMVALRVLGEQLFAGLSVNDEEARQYFAEHSNEFNFPERVKLSQILLPNRMAADLMLDKLNSGAVFKELADEHSIDKRSARLGGYMGIFPREALETAIAEAAFSLRPGDFSGIIETEHGYHILQLEEILPAKTYEFDEIRGKVRKATLREKQVERFDTYLNDLSAAAAVDVNDKALHKMFSELATRSPQPPARPHL